MRLKLIINCLLMNLNWYLFLALPVHWQSIAWVGLATLVFLNLRWIKSQQKEFLFIVLATLWGLVMELIFIHSSSIHYPQTSNIVPPLFMIGLWINFACAFSFCLKWLLEKPMLAIIFGSIMGPFAYWAGARISVEITPINSFQSILVIAIAYFATMLCLPKLYHLIHSSEKKYVTA